uniref:Uncharacterized protein n=1 Tax=Trypanosoma congolense (strain IL3000) TaxID=1068625 RepID=G0UJK2_TRYCI|nr:conserved hypothetical protein [Trypanosoma congolense IL3000]
MRVSGSARSSTRPGKTSDVRLPAAVLEKEMKVLNSTSSTSRAMAGQLENCARLVRGYQASLKYCNEKIEGALLSLGVDASHSLITTITNVVEGLDTLSGVCRAMQDAYNEDIRQREELYSLLAGAYLSLKELHEATESELKSVVADRDRKVASFGRAVSYVESVVAERMIWQELNGYNCAGLPLVERTFAEHCHEALRKFDEINLEANAGNSCSAGRLLVGTDTPTDLVQRWESIENVRHANGIPSARALYVPPRKEVELLRSVLDMGTGERVLMWDIQERERTFREMAANVYNLGHACRNELQQMRSDLAEFRRWLLNMDRRCEPIAVAIKRLRSRMDEYTEVQEMKTDVGRPDPSTM